MSDGTKGNSPVSPGALPPVATEDALADALAAVVNAPDEGVVSDDDLGSWLDGVKADTGLSKGDLTLTTLQNDPLNGGTSVQQHRTAQWAALLWKHAVSDRRDDEIHVRGVHYVARDVDIPVPSPNPTTEENPNGTDWDKYRNTTECRAYMVEALKSARTLGYIPYDGIHDSNITPTQYRTTRGGHDLPDGSETTGLLGSGTNHATLRLPNAPSFSARAYRQWGDSRTSADRSSPESFTEDAVRTLTGQLMGEVSIDTEAEQPYHIEVWSEKSLPSEVKKAARSAGANVVVEGQGCMSLTQAFEFGERVERVGKPAIVLYLSDFDPAGDSMPAQTANKFEWLKSNPRVELTERVYVERLALTAEQVAENDLPRQPLDPDNYSESYRAQIEEFGETHGAGTTELNALETDLSLFRRIVRDGIEQYRDHDLTRKKRDARDEYEEACRDAVRDAIEDSGVCDHLADINEWIQDVDDMAGEYEDDVAELRKEFKEELADLKDEDAYQDFTDAHNDIGPNVEVPTFDPPEGSVPAPDDPLYDSAREYLETLDRANGGNIGGGKA